MNKIIISFLALTISYGCAVPAENALEIQIVDVMNQYREVGTGAGSSEISDELCSYLDYYQLGLIEKNGMSGYRIRSGYSSIKLYDDQPDTIKYLIISRTNGFLNNQTMFINYNLDHDYCRVYIRQGMK